MRIIKWLIRLIIQDKEQDEMFSKEQVIKRTLLSSPFIGHWKQEAGKNGWKKYINDHGSSEWSFIILICMIFIFWCLWLYIFHN